MKQGRCLFAVVFASAFVLASIPVHGEVHFELNFAHTYSDYVVYAELSSSIPTTTVHRVESPDGRIWKETDGDGNSSAYIWTNSFEGLLYTVTNGQWRLILNHDSPSAETNWFTVAASNFNAATFGNPDITYPTEGTTITNNQPTLEWTGPSHLPSLFVWLDGDTTTFHEYEWLDSTETTWTPSTPLPEDSYSSYINYEHKDYKDVFTTTPSNAMGVALSGWTNKFGIASYNWTHFSVTNPPAGPPSSLSTALEAYYLPWTTGGDADWFSQTNETYDGTDAARSGAIGLYETSWLETTVTNDGTMQYWMYIDADEYDYVEITVNGSFYDSYDGWYGGWDYFDIYDLYAGDTVRWTFYNDDDTAAGADAVFIDFVQFGEYDLGLWVDAPQLPWSTGGDEAWDESWGESQDGVDAAMSPPGGGLGLDGESWIETTIQGPGTLSFWWGLMADSGDDLQFDLNGSTVDALNGDWGWDSKQIELAPGPNTLRWTFINGDDSAMSQDAAFLDLVVFEPSTATEPEYEADLTVSIQRIREGTNEFYTVQSFFTSYAPTNQEIEVASYTGAMGGGEYWTWRPVFTNLQQAIDECEAGPWSIYFNRNEANEKEFTFEVYLPLLATNDLPPVTILSPANGATGVATNPPYAWLGPASYSYISAILFDVGNDEYLRIQSLPASETTWTNVPAATVGTNEFRLNYTLNSYPHVIITDPEDGSSAQLSSWAAHADLVSRDKSVFVVAAGIAPLPVTLLPPMVAGGNMALSFISQSGAVHYIEWSTNLVTGPWMPATNFPGDGTTNMVTLPTTNPAAYFKVETE